MTLLWVFGGATIVYRVAQLEEQFDESSWLEREPLAALRQVSAGIAKPHDPPLVVPVSRAPTAITSPEP